VGEEHRKALKPLSPLFADLRDKTTAKSLGLGFVSGHDFSRAVRA
jgi:hypothetical protein